MTQVLCVPVALSKLPPLNITACEKNVMPETDAGSGLSVRLPTSQ